MRVFDAPLAVGVGGAVLKLRPVFLEGVRDVLQEDQAQDDVLVLGRVQVVAQLVRRQPQLGLEAEVRARLALLLCLRHLSRRFVR
jgi:hypothetical protein